jgi:hypothetical protein
MKKHIQNSKLRLNLRGEKVRELTVRLTNSDLAAAAGGIAASGGCSTIKNGEG